MLALRSSRRLHRRSERHRSPAATEPQCPDYVQAKAGRPVAPTSGLLELGHLFPGSRFTLRNMPMVDRRVLVIVTMRCRPQAR
jgi:hypothetical protein